MDKKKPNISGLTGRPDKVYEEYNKLPGLVQDYRRGMMRNLKDKFVEQLKAAKKAELEYCNAKHVEPILTIPMYNKICDLVTRCRTIFQIEALARYVFDMNEIPTFEQVMWKADDIERVFPWKVGS